MKKISLIFIFLLFTLQISFSQSCLPQGIDFNSQAEIDNFQTNYPNCTEIEGDVEIYGDDISNLNGLNNLVSIGGELLIGYEEDNNWPINPLLYNLNGLDNLTTIGGRLFIIDNDVLNSLSGLQSLSSIGGSLVIGLNANLTDISALNSLTHIQNTLELAYNYSLTSLMGLHNVTSIGGSLFILACPIYNLDDFINLINIGGGIWLFENHNLLNINALINITAAVGISIHSNSNLSSLSGLDNINAESIQNIYIINNNSLSECEVTSICNYITNTNEDIDLYNNASGCNNIEEVEQACITGSQELKAEFLVSIYPNPASKELFISTAINQPAQEVCIYDQLGKIVLDEKTLSNTIDISMLSKGVYIIEFILNKEKSRMKLIIE